MEWTPRLHRGYQKSSNLLFSTKFGVIGYLVKLTALQAVELSSILSDSTKQIKEIIWYS
ncbi:hypothetical protein HWC16_gp176 [Salmonella phage Sepoy]|uniref:Uncharacterized protein n=1 Tax=Salmonella phage Sepoy TaxID=2565517 RepID=A0A4P8NN91_9CAUD|nr:hypothetical protein HWC16_gp176 [Salmonella phage Sepoy]QCQ65566.1 hypothetical protein Sepoy_083 [Salmonella phage Sepoy]